MVFGRTTRKSLSCLNQNGTISKQLTVVISDIESNDSPSRNVPSFEQIIISDSDETVKDNPIQRPKRSIERQNYNQIKLEQKVFHQNQEIKEPGSSVIRKKKESKQKVLDKTITMKIPKSKKEPTPALSEVLNFEGLLGKISPFKKSLSQRRPTAPVSNGASSNGAAVDGSVRFRGRVQKSNDSRARKTVLGRDRQEKLAKIRDRAFRYPWEWDSIQHQQQKQLQLGQQQLQQQLHNSQILGFRTLTDGVNESLMWMC